MRRLSALACATALLAGCSTGSAWVRDPRSGQVAECGPYFTPTHLYESAGYRRLRECVEDYRAQGWERTAEPVTK